jgi:hypothetical protein
MITTTYRHGSQWFQVVRTERETYIKLDNGVEVVDDVAQWIAHYVAQGFRPAGA